MRQLEHQILEQSGRVGRLKECLRVLEGYNGNLMEFDEKLWNALVETATVSQDKTITFHLYDGTDIPIKLPERATKGKR